MKVLEKFQTPVLFLAIIAGLLLGYVPVAERHAESLVMPFLFAMLFGVFLNTPVRDFRQAAGNVKFTLTAAAINFIWTPLLVIGLGMVFLADSPMMQIGFLMLMVTPCTDWYLVFTGVAKGNVTLSATVLPVNLVLQVVLLPVYLYLAAGVSGSIRMGEVLSGIFFILVVPFVLAQLTRVILAKRSAASTQAKVADTFASLQTLFLALAILSMFAAKGNSLLANLGTVSKLIVPILLFYAVNFVLAQLVGKLYRYRYEETASLTLTTIAKNSPMTLGIALLAFPDEPVIHLIMLIEPLIELPVMLLISKGLLRLRERQAAAG